jgi:radical SAM superfamily enzyme YgiQ (UPF0313 family)
MISTLREEGFEAMILHPIHEINVDSRQRLIDDLLRINPRIAGFTTYDSNLLDLFHFIHDVREAGFRSHITLGGFSASSVAEEILAFSSHVDSVVRGEGDFAIVDLARIVIRGEHREREGIFLRQGDEIRFPGPRPLIDDLDILPLPVCDDFMVNGRQSVLKYTSGDALVAASRGCYGKCAFCSPHSFYEAHPGRSWRGRGAGKIVQEIAAAVRLNGARSLTFVDENFLGPGQVGRRHALSVAGEMEKNSLSIPFNFACRPNDVDRATFAALKDSGLSAVTLGIESMSPETLKLFAKGTTPEINERAIGILEELKLFVEITFIFFHPLISLNEIRMNLDFLQRVQESSFAYFSKNMPFTEWIPLFKTKLTDRLEALNLVQRNFPEYTFRYGDPRIEELVGMIRSVPLDHLSRFTNGLRSSDPELKEVLQSLRKYEIHLNMVRLPELLSDGCDVLDRHDSLTGRQGRAILHEIDQEIERIDSMFRLFETLRRER